MKLVLFTALGLASLGLTGVPVQAQSEKPSEYNVKAVYLFNFANFVTWPELDRVDSTVPFRIGVLGINPFGDALEGVIEGENVDGHPIVIEVADSADKLNSCQIVYMSETGHSQLETILGQFADNQILTVGEAEGFIELGGVVGFVTGDKRIQFELNMVVARAVGLDISSRLQRVASRVISSEGSGNQ